MEKIIFDVQRFAETAAIGESADSVSSYETVPAVFRGTSNDDLITASRNFAESQVRIFGGDGITTSTSLGLASTILGEAGNDTIATFVNTYHSINGGDGDDRIYISGTNNSSVMADHFNTITSGAGSDTIEVKRNSGGVIVTDFSSDDVIVIEDSSGYYANGSSPYYTRRRLTQTVEDGNVVLRDGMLLGNTSVKSGYIPYEEAAEPTFSVTLQGVSDISQVADAEIYVYGEATSKRSFSHPFWSSEYAPEIYIYKDNDIEGASTLGEIFAVSKAEGSMTSTANNVSSGVVDNSVITKQDNSYTYNAGRRIISNYQVGEVVKFNSDYKDFSVSGSTFYLNSSSGWLRIDDAYNKVVSYSLSDNEGVAAYSYVAKSNGSTTVDGRGISQTEIIIGANNSDDKIYAGLGGSILWGGKLNQSSFMTYPSVHKTDNDTLFGGDGYDEFIYKMGSGNDVVKNADSNDVVNLSDVTLEQISAIDVGESAISLSFTDGGSLLVEGNTDVGFKLNNVVYSVNRHTSEWSTK